MPIAILIVGIILVVAGINDKLGELKSLLAEDFKPSDGSTPFQVWIIALVVLGSLGYIKSLKPLSYAFIVLVFVALFVKKDRGFFAQFSKAVKGS